MNAFKTLLAFLVFRNDVEDEEKKDLDPCLKLFDANGVKLREEGLRKRGDPLRERGEALRDLGETITDGTPV